MNTKTTVTIETYHYENSYGRKPRGFGSWAFHKDCNARGRDPEVFCVHCSNYGEAVKKARAHFAAQGI